MSINSRSRFLVLFKASYKRGRTRTDGGREKRLRYEIEYNTIGIGYQKSFRDRGTSAPILATPHAGCNRTLVLSLNLKFPICTPRLIQLP